VDAAHFSSDIHEFISLLSKYSVKYVIVGGEAVIYYGHARLTGDLDLFYEASSENAGRLFTALTDFWGGEIPGIKAPEEFLNIGTIIQFGVPPNRIDLINSIEDVSFAEAWASRTAEKIESQDKKYPVYYIGLEKLIKNKRAMGRHKDLDDLEYLEKVFKKTK